MIPAIPFAVATPTQHRANEPSASIEDAGDDNRFATVLGQDAPMDQDTVSAPSEDQPDATATEAAEEGGAPEETPVEDERTPDLVLPTPSTEDIPVEVLVETSGAKNLPASDIKTSEKAAVDVKKISTPRGSDAEASKASDTTKSPTTLPIGPNTTPAGQSAGAAKTAEDQSDTKQQTSPDPKASWRSGTEHASAQSGRTQAQVTSDTASSSQTPAANAARSQDLPQSTPKMQHATTRADEMLTISTRSDSASKPTNGPTLSQAIVEHRSAKSAALPEKPSRYRDRAKAAAASPTPQPQAPPTEVSDIATPKPAVTADAPMITARDNVEPLAKLDPASPAFERSTVASSQAASAAQPTTAADQARQIAQQMAAVVPSTVPGTTDITLQPEELGRVRMTLTVQDGALTLLIQADRTETSDLMRRNIDQLAQAYRQMGFDTLSFSFANSSQHGDTSDAPHQPDAGGPDDGPVIATTTPDTPLRTSPSGRLDVRI